MWTTSWRRSTPARCASKDWTVTWGIRPSLGRLVRLTGGVLALWAAGCGDLGRRYWTPTPDQLKAAEQIAKFHVFTNLSDQAGPTALSKLVLGAEGLPREYPIAFTIGGTPYVRYRTRMWGGITKGRRLIHIEYFDPSAIPDWERRAEPAGEFPAYFRVSVDVAAARTVSDSRSGEVR